MEDMVGHWKLHKRDENFDAFLRCRQVVFRPYVETAVMAGELVPAYDDDQRVGGGGVSAE
jgi:hypothetical protein